VQRLSRRCLRIRVAYVNCDEALVVAVQGVSEVCDDDDDADDDMMSG
jgi:hypothetical protein